MSDQQRDPEADGPEDATDPELEDDAEPGADEVEAADEDVEGEPEDLEFADEEPEDEEFADEEGLGEVEEEPEAAAAAAPKGAKPKSGRKGKATPKAAPTAAEEAVHVQDRASAYFVIATVGVFVVLFGWAILLGSNGIINDALKTPKPTLAPIESVLPSVLPSVEPSVPSSAEPSVAPTTTPGESPAVESPSAS